MKKVASYIKKVLLVVIVLTGWNVCSEGLGPGSPDTPPPPVGLPIDGGVLWLLISGLVLGVFKNVKRRG